LPVLQNIVRSHPAYNTDGPWLDFIKASFTDKDGLNYTAPARVELMYYLPENPDKRFLVVHPAYEFHCSHSVLTSFHRMQYTDDPVDIMVSEDILDFETMTYVLDDDSTTDLPCPHLVTINSDAVGEHTLMVPYHPLSKFMIGVRNQNEWANEFLPTT
jgi:hypothetical protein